jgi:hypothetical protein
MIPIDHERLERIVARIRGGFPPETFEDLRYLAEVATGTEIPVKHRCAACQGNGMIDSVPIDIPSGMVLPSIEECPACAGTGFEPPART